GKAGMQVEYADSSIVDGYGQIDAGAAVAAQHAREAGLCAGVDGCNRGDDVAVQGVMVFGFGAADDDAGGDAGLFGQPYRLCVTGNQGGDVQTAAEGAAVRVAVGGQWRVGREHAGVVAIEAYAGGTGQRDILPDLTVEAIDIRAGHGLPSLSSCDQAS